MTADEIKRTIRMFGYTQDYVAARLGLSIRIMRDVYQDEVPSDDPDRVRLVGFLKHQLKRAREIGAEIRYERERIGMTKSEFARLMGFGNGRHLTIFEEGKVAPYNAMEALLTVRERLAEG